MMDKPYLSLVVTTRNDDHGGSMLQRFQSFLDHLDDMSDRHRLAMELIVVEWNPDPERAPLVEVMSWPKSAHLRTRIITVPPSVHKAHDNHDKFPLFQMIAKNVGIRRAQGEFILATNIDLIFSDELCAFLASRSLDPDCFYRIDRHDIGAERLPEGLTWQERLSFCEQNIIRVQGQYGTYTWGNPSRTGDPQKLHTNACGDFTLLSRSRLQELKGYPEFHLWSIFIDGLLVHAAAATGLKQVILRDPCRIYHIEHDLGWAKTTEPIKVRPSLDYHGQYVPLCKSIMAARKPLDINKIDWGLNGLDLQETVIGGIAPAGSMSGAERDRDSRNTFAHWIDILAAIDRRLYYRDQSSESLTSLEELARQHDPTVIVELGTLSGLSLRAWLKATSRARIHAVDLSFKPLRETSRYFPVDFSRVVLHEQNILSLDFRGLWDEDDRVLFFVDAHDLPDASIMEHVLSAALPNLPSGSLVVVDDLWHSPQRLTGANCESFFRETLLAEIDELQCFSGYFAPYHAGGSFMGFREVVPLLEFVNSRGIELKFTKGGKHAWFSWDLGMPARDVVGTVLWSDSEHGVVEHNPLNLTSTQPKASQVLPAAAQAYKQRKVTEAMPLLQDLIKTAACPEANLALAICHARLGALEQAYESGKLACEPSGENWRAERLVRDLERKLGIAGIRKTGRKGLTLFAVPKPFLGHAGVIQRNALRSWSRLLPRPEIILFGDEPGIAEMAAEINARHVPEVARNDFGTPLLDNIFRQAADLASNDILAYVNADIILLDDFSAGVDAVTANYEEFLLIGQRWDLSLTREIDFSEPEWTDILLRELEQEGILHAETGLDYFVHSKGLWRCMPPFALGRCAWDNWLVMQPVKSGRTVIDGTQCITAIHQDHDYGHIQGNRHAAFHGIEAARNKAMLGPVDSSGFATGAKWMLTKDGRIIEKPASTARFDDPEFRRKRLHWLISQADKLERKGRKDLAAAKYEEALTLDPQNMQLAERLKAARDEQQLRNPGRFISQSAETQ